MDCSFIIDITEDGDCLLHSPQINEERNGKLYFGKYKYFAEFKLHGNLSHLIPCNIVEKADTSLTGYWVTVDLAYPVPHPHYGTTRRVTIEVSRISEIPAEFFALEAYADQMDKFSPELI